MAGMKAFSGGISAGPCPGNGCTCGNVVVRLHDLNGRPVTGIVLPRETAQLFMEQLAAALDGRQMPKPSGLHSIRCEGTA